MRVAVCWLEETLRALDLRRARSSTTRRLEPGRPPGAFTPRNGHKAVLLSSGKVFVIGGSADEVGTEIYDPATGTWTRGHSMYTPRIEFTATLLANGKVLVAGGDNFSGDLDECELYDPATGDWT